MVDKKKKKKKTKLHEYDKDSWLTFITLFHRVRVDFYDGGYFDERGSYIGGE
jgi:hypothetical protein